MPKARPYKLFLLLLAIGGGYGWLIFATLHPHLPCHDNPLVFYSSQTRDDLKRVIFSAIKGAKTSISLQIYGLTDPDIIALLHKKKAEGLDVSISYDRSASKHLPKTLEAKPIRAKGLMHRKILVIDKTLCLIGTANFTPQSLKMHGNLLVGLYSPLLAKALVENKSYKEEGLESYLLPEAGEEALTKLCTVIENAQKTLKLAIFTLTHPRIIDSLIRAHKRGVAISLCVDRYTAQGASRKALCSLEESGITILQSQGDQLLHHKWALVDQKILIFGSANWTVAAFEKNHDGLWMFESLQPAELQKLQKLWKVIETGCQMR